jgi:D-alanyl-lipoteichoic acid acyltransferase DltB (MBOAT superfamily)
MDNFNTPYLSKSITEFWARWHISLSSWFRDYLYIPLGGNRVTLPRWVFNILIVFLISGLWHGPSWTFVVWGGLHGLMILLERFTSKMFGIKINEGFSFFNVLLVIKTFILTSFIWIFFRAENFAKAKLVFWSVFNNWNVPVVSTQVQLALIFSVVILVVDVFLYNTRFDLRLSRLPAIARWAVYTIILFCLMTLSGTQKFTFIYFQF